MIKTILLMFVSIVILTPTSSFAEGSMTAGGGENGVNRRVITEPNGYIGVKGHFSVSMAQTPPLIPGSEEYPNPALNPDNANHYRSTPTYYLGSRLNVGASKEVDAGLQYYNDRVDYKSGNKLLSGWGAFIRHAGTRGDNFITPQKAVKITGGGYEWEGMRDSSNGFAATLTYEIIPTGSRKGQAEITVDGGIFNITFPWSQATRDSKTPSSTNKFFPAAGDGTQVYTTTDMSHTAVKRVIGLTQGGSPEFDGSILVGTFSKGQITENGHDWEDWVYQKKVDNKTVTIVDEGNTGYDVAESAKDAQYNHNDTMASKFIVTFPNVDGYGDYSADYTRMIIARDKSEDSNKVEENGNSRYTQETIKISLRSATKLTGKEVTPRSDN